jgi:hypothetical protein
LRKRLARIIALMLACKSLFLAGGLLLVATALRAQVAPPAAPAKAAPKIETFLVPIRLTVAADGSGKYRTI